MTNDLKYRKPIPIKAEMGTPFKRDWKKDEQRRKAIALKNKQENTRNRNISKSYFSQAPSIQNLAKGVYYWAKSDPKLFGKNEDPHVMTGVAPAISIPATGVANVAQILNKAKQYIPAVAAVSALLGGSGSQVLAEEEAEPTSTTGLGGGTIIVGGQTITTPNSSSNNQDEQNKENEQEQNNASQNNKQDSSNTPPKKPNRFRQTLKESGEKWKDRGNKALKFGLNTLPWMTAVGGGVAYGTKELWHKDKEMTPTDSILQRQANQIQELQKLKQVNRNQEIIDSLTNAASRKQSTLPSKPRVTSSTQAEIDSINNLYYNDDYNY